MDDYNDRKEQYEKYINSKKEQSAEQLEQNTVLQSSLENNPNLGKVINVNGAVVYTDRKNHDGMSDTYVEDAYYVDDDIAILSDGASDTWAGRVSHQLVQEIAKRKNEIADLESFFGVVHNLEIPNANVDNRFTPGGAGNQLGTLIVYLPKLQKAFVIGDSVVEVDGKQISGKTEGKNAVVSLVEDTKKVSILKNKIVEVDTPTNNVRLYTDEIPKFNPSNKVFGQLVGELKKTTKLNDDVTIIDFTNKTFPTQPVEQLEQAPVTITPEAINDFKEIIEEVKKLKNKMGKLTMNKMIDDIQTYYNNKETVNLIANLETLLKTIKDIDPLALENKEIFIEKIKQYTTNKNCQI